MSPVARSLARLRSLGYAAGVVEYWNAFARRRIDFFGCVDIIAVHPDVSGALAVQATTRTNVSHRFEKALGCPELRVWLAAGNRYVVWGWAKCGSRWDVREVELRAGDLEQIVLRCPKHRRGRKQRTLFEE